MSVGLQVWSQTAATNSTADTNINWPEGMAPSQVNDSARAMMASMAKWRDDNNGSIVTGGTTLAYTVTTSQVEASLTSGYTVAFQMNATNDSSATLNVDGLGAKPMQTTVGNSLVFGELSVGNIYRATYSTTGTGQWIITSGVVQDLPTAVPVITTFSSTSSVTWNSTTKNGLFPTFLVVRMVGGGGGGGAASTNAGSSGTDTTFNNWGATGATGGNAGAAAGGQCGASGATGTGTQIRRIKGAAGTFGNTAGVSLGGASAVGGAGVQFGSATGTNAAANSGSGGSGGTNAGTTGAAGGGGEYVEFQVTSPSTSYTIQVGAGGAGGASGGAAGGNGAAGLIEVFAYWQ